MTTLTVKRKNLDDFTHSKKPHFLSVDIIWGSLYIPKDNISNPIGEDAHFICQERQIVGLADGVGGWASNGVDAGLFARQLMRNSAAIVSEVVTVDPVILLEESLKRTSAKGSSTALILSLERNLLRATLLGDSGVAVFRNQKLVFQSESQQHRFNCPFQLSSGGSSDKPASAWQASFPIMSGDIIVGATDGFFDNMFTWEIEAALSMMKFSDPRKVAFFLAGLAWFNSVDASTESPFAVEARKCGFLYHGGKEDDITVVVGRVL